MAYDDRLAQARARLAQELQANPQLKAKIMAISAGENNDPAANQAVLESMFNRAAMMGTPLSLEGRRTSEGGYYAGYNPSALNNQATRAMIEKNLDEVLKGSNVSNYATDNASEGNSHFASRRFASGMYSPTYSSGGEFFSYPSNADARGFKQYPAWLASLGASAPQAIDPSTVAASGAAQASAAPAIASVPASPAQPSPFSLAGIISAAGGNPSNIGGTGVSLSNGVLSIPGLGMSISGQAQAPQEAQQPDQSAPLAMAPQIRKPLDMRGIAALAQKQPLGLLGV